MKRADELRDPQSCINKAENEEMVFVLLARDVCAPDIIRAWCDARVVAGKNNWEDPQITEALQAAAAMEKWRAERVK